MQPNLLLRSSGECTRSQKILHLSHAGEQNSSSKEPLDSLLAGRGCQAALVRPELLEVADLADSLVRVDVYVLDLGGVVEVDGWGRELAEEAGVCAAGVKTDGDDGAGGSVAGVAGMILAFGLAWVNQEGEGNILY